MRNSTKLKIKSVVDEYKVMFPEDYKGTCEVVLHQRKNLKNEYASVIGSHVLQRALFSISEVLQGLIESRLDVGELTEFKEKESSRWFAKTYKEFSLATKI